MLNSGHRRSAPRRDSSRREISYTSPRRMWRSSARGWTVMLLAPAARHVSTARITEGSGAPRELRSVATLLTLTDSSTISCHPSGEMFADDGLDPSGPSVDDVLRGPFDHDAQQRLGPGIAHEHPPLSVERRFGLADDGADGRHFVDRTPLLHPHVDERLRIRHELGGQIGQLGPG